MSQDTNKLRNSDFATRIAMGTAFLLLIVSLGSGQTPSQGVEPGAGENHQPPPSGGLPQPNSAMRPFMPSGNQLFCQMGAAGDMIGFSHSDASGTQTITLVDTRKSWLAVYHIERSGSARLVSSRPIDADFSLQLNATDPLPENIRRMTR